KNRVIEPSDAVSSVPGSDVTSVIGNVRASNNIKYPKITIKKFEADLKEWLEFWAQFKNIHEDPQLPVSGKFQYLVQSTTKGSKAYGVVFSYPQDDDNYIKVIEALKKRFRKEEILVEVYVRELLKLVINNNQNPKTKGLSVMFDTLKSHLRSLESLGVTREKYAAMLFPLVECSLSDETLQAWQRSYLIQDTKSDKLANLMSFLEGKVEGEERIKLALANFISGPMHRRQQKHRYKIRERPFHTAAGLHTANSTSTVSKGSFCLFCDGIHDSDRCIKGQNLTLEERRAKVHEKKRCFCCLAGGHGAKFCRKQVRCPVCSRRHFAILCPMIPSGPKESGKPEETTSQTTLWRLKIEAISYYKLLCGARRSYVKEDVALSVGAVFVEAECLAVTPVRPINKYKFTLQSLNGVTSQEIEALSQKRICEYIPKLHSGPWLRELSDKKIWINARASESADVDLIISCDYYGNLLTGSTVKLECGLSAMETIFGWAVLGETKNKFVSKGVAMAVSCLALNNVDVSDLDSIPDNFKIAEKRLSKLAQRLKRSDQFKVYHNIFMEWEHENLIEKVRDGVSGGHYLPHRPVFKIENKTTPVRPVFDASAGRPSLNDHLEKGPNFLQLIPSLILKFREKRFGLVADIRRAFMMIKVNLENRDFLRFLWWKSEDAREMQVYQHNRVVFGVNCSPFLLHAVIAYHLDNAASSSQKYAQVLKNSFYVDNCILSVDSVKEMDEFKIVATELLPDAKMELRMWENTVVSRNENFHISSN
ncbi:hypothetical protein ILUMI_14833, partial [Ignelater luminosus]